jgi:RHS repeat-associated protein
MDKLIKETITDPVTGTTIISYTYDAVGNRLTKTENGVTTNYTYDDNDRLIQEGDITYSYDNNGNLIEKDSAEEQISYSYDYENRLIRVETTKFGATIVIEYAYDAQGNRIKKTIDGLVTTTYLVDENRDYAQVVEERNGEGNLLVRYVYGLDLISQTRAGATSYYHYDGQGSTRALTNTSQSVTDTYTYDAFGILLDKTGSTVNTYRYTGEQFDANVGFYYLRARYMNPAIGRFITMDAFAGRNRDPYSLHKYLYANANPVTYVDPSGYEGYVKTLTTNSILPTIAALCARLGHLAQLLGHPLIVGLMAMSATMLADMVIDEAVVESVEAEDPNNKRPRPLYRGLSNKDMKEYKDYWMIFSWAVRKLKDGSRDEVKTAKKNTEKLREILASQNWEDPQWGDLLKNHRLSSKLFISPFISLTKYEDFAKDFAKRKPDPSFHLVTVFTNRAYPNTKNPFNEGEYVIPFVIFRGIEARFLRHVDS